MTRRPATAAPATETTRGETPRLHPDLGISHGTSIEAVFSDPALYELAGELPKPDPRRGGRPRTYPDFLVLGFAMLSDVYRSGRQAATELHDRTTWNRICEIVTQHCPDPALRSLPDRPPSRTWYYKRRERILDERVLRTLQDGLTRTGIATARDLGLLDPHGSGSPTRPDPTRLIYCDGKVITPLFTTKPGETRTVRSVDPETGEVTETQRPVRYDPDAKAHTTGDGRQVHGSKFWMAATRGVERHQIVTLAVEHVPTEKGKHNSEADITTEALLKLAPNTPGALGVLVDTVLRGTHLDRLQRATGWAIISPVAAARVDKNTGKRTEKEHFIRTVDVSGPGAATEKVEIWTVGGRLHRLVDADGGQVLVPLRRVGNPHRKNRDGTYRTYVEYEVPSAHPDGKATVIRERTYTNDDDRRAGFNRAENVRQIPPGDPGYQELYPQRNNAESANRRVDDHLYRERARSIGAQRQLLDLIARGLVVNAVARHLYGRQADAPPQAA